MDLSSLYLHDHDASRPTIFEVVAADEMPDLLYNAASHIAHVSSPFLYMFRSPGR